METTKFLRLSIPGWMLLLSFVIFKYIFDGPDILDCHLKQVIIPIVSLILTSSLLGIIISTISYFLIHIIFSHLIYFQRRRNWSKEYNQVLFREISFCYRQGDLKQEINELESIFEKFKNQGLPRRNNNSRRLFDFYQILLRQKMNPETLNYSKRAWDFFYLNLNNLIAFIIGFFIAISFKNEMCGDKNITVIVLIAVYVASALWHLIKCRNDAINVERNWLESITTPNSRYN